MSIQQMLLGASGASGYLMDKSLRFRASASAYLNRTMGTPTNNKIYTFSAWVKRGSLGSLQSLLGYANPGNTEATAIYISASDVISFFARTGGVDAVDIRSTQVSRDPSAWFHLVLAYDTTQATASNRVKIYYNGTQITSFSLATYPALNDNWYINNASTTNYIGSSNTTINFFDGYLADTYFIDGQALTPASFGETNALTGVWQPKAYTGTYGTNGFYLDFENTSSVAALGTDKSGNGNTWTVNNVSLTAGVTYDSMTDVPTLTSATAANYAVLNPLDTNRQILIDQANLRIAYNGATFGNIRGTIGVTSGKWYWESVITSSGVISSVVGIYRNDTPIASSFGANAYGYTYLGNKRSNGIDTAYGATYTTNDIIGTAFDADNGTITFYKNNVSQGVAYTGITGGAFLPALSTNEGTVAMNFGQRPFAYTPPTGFVALNTFNLPTATILKGNTVMDATLYTGNGSTQTIANAAGFQPDLVWVKSRSSALEHKESNAVRGATKATKPNSTDPETTDTNGITAFNSNGFSLGSDSNYNTNAATYAAWQWKAGNTTSSNTDGSITSTVSVNASAGFSILTFNGTGANATVGHGLGVAPSMFIVKNLTNAAGNWAMAHSGLSSFSGDAIYLNSTAAQFSAGTFWNSTAPTSSVINLGSSPQVNESAQPIMAQVWAAIAGYSSFGTYTGNGSTDGTFVYTGFRPKVIWIKNRGAANGWRQYDTTRSPYNLTNLYLQSSSSAAEQTSGASIDILSNGFKIRDSDAGVNGSGSVYIYACWAENPFKNSLAR